MPSAAGPARRRGAFWSPGTDWLLVGVLASMAQGGSTMGEEPGWAELLLSAALVAGVPTVIGGTVILSLVGLTMWVTAPLRRRRRTGSHDG